jgi:hypothetical protein
MKFMFLAQGFEKPTDEIRQAWMDWFVGLGDSIVDSGSPFGPGREVTLEGTRDLPLGPDSFTGYTIVQAEDMDAAERLLDDCPIITAMRIYPAMSM